MTPDITNRGKSQKESEDQLGNQGKKGHRSGLLLSGELLLAVLAHRTLVQFIMPETSSPTGYRHLKLRRRIVRIISIGRESQGFHHRRAFVSATATSCESPSVNLMRASSL